MLVCTLLTLFVGPALVFVILGSAILVLAAFAVYPIISVMVIWLGFFFTSQLAQAIGRKLGLDKDKDGDVDFLDVLHYAAYSTQWGKSIGLPKLYKMLNDSTMDPFREIHRRLDEIQHNMDSVDTKGSSSTRKDQ
jgi:tetrahydromethanopterin S-methyltransferase subunit G